MEKYKLVTGNTGLTVTPADDGALRKYLIGYGLYYLGIWTGDTSNEYGKVMITQSELNTKACMQAGEYLFQGRHIRLFDNVIVDVSAAEEGALIGFMYNRAADGTESIEPIVKAADAVTLADIDLQNSGIIVFGTLGIDTDGNRYIEKNYVEQLRVFADVTNTFSKSIHQTDVQIPIGATKLVSIPHSDLTNKKYLVILSIITDTAPPTNPTEIKIRFAGNSAYDYVVRSKETALQVVGIHEFTLDDVFDYTTTIDAYIWNQDGAMTIKDLKFEIYQLM